jgi:type II secretory pathway pseudopilin PulG
MAFLKPSGRVSAFTLLEVLTSCVVLGLLVVLVAQLVNGFTSTSANSRKQIESDNSSRTVLNALATDLEKMVQRTKGDVDGVFSKQGGNDQLFFFSEAPGYIALSSIPEKSTISLIGYRILEVSDSLGSKLQLQRLGKALTWSQNNIVFHPISVDASQQTDSSDAIASIINGADGYHVVSEDIFRIEFCFMTNSGGYFEPSKGWKPWGDDNNDGVANIKDVSAVVVTIASLDQASRSLVKQMGTLASALPDSSLSTDPTNPTIDPSLLPAALWKQKIESPDFPSAAGIPQLAASALRVYHRVYFLNNR